MSLPKKEAVLALVAGLGLAGCQAPVAPASEADEVYRDTCLLCHTGGVAGAMAPDLTTLSAVNGGTFPAEEVAAIIDGRGDIRAHGSPMPVWGERYSPELVEDLTTYLASIQR